MNDPTVNPAVRRLSDRLTGVELARLVGVDARTVRRWLGGDQPKGAVHLLLVVADRHSQRPGGGEWLTTAASLGLAWWLDAALSGGAQ